jgi:hypothetical protein
MLDTLRTCGPYWVREQQQLGMQAGQYALVIYTSTLIKRTEVLLKTLILAASILGNVDTMWACK